MHSPSKESFFSFRNASILNVPLCILFLWFLTGWLLATAFLSTYPTKLEQDFSMLFIVPTLFGYYVVPTIGVPYLVCSLFILIMTVKRVSLTSKQRFLFVFYSIILLFYFGYVGWWYITGQHFDYP